MKSRLHKKHIFWWPRVTLWTRFMVVFKNWPLRTGIHPSHDKKNIMWFVWTIIVSKTTISPLKNGNFKIKWVKKTFMKFEFLPLYILFYNYHLLRCENVVFDTINYDSNQFGNFRDLFSKLFSFAITRVNSEKISTSVMYSEISRCFRDTSNLKWSMVNSVWTLISLRNNYVFRLNR